MERKVSRFLSEAALSLEAKLAEAEERLENERIASAEIERELRDECDAERARADEVESGSKQMAKVAHQELTKALLEIESERTRANQAEAGLAAAERELERWRDGVPIEGDYVSPKDLEIDKLKEEIRCLKRDYAMEMTWDSPNPQGSEDHIKDAKWEAASYWPEDDIEEIFKDIHETVWCKD